MRASNVRSTTVLTALLLCTTITAVADEVDLDKKQTFDIGPQSLESALLEFSEQADVQILLAANDIQGRRTEGVQGQSSPREALDVLLQDTALGYSAIGSTISVTAKDSEAEDPGNARTTPRPMMMAQASVEQSQTSRRTATDSEEDEKRWPLEEILVTGTRLKGVKDQFSPVTQISREEMDLAGFNNLSDVFDSLPQNFGGGVTIDTSQANSLNGPGAAGVNLRGLGNQATLILLNGRRLAAGGGRGSFIDISTIPASAIERVDVLTDGASAIYGSDAIAGVVNIILRDDFDGAETRLNVGTITDGGLDFMKAGQTLGWSDAHAHAMVTYEYSVDDELDASQKDFSEDATEPTWLLPDTRKQAVFASTGAQLSDRVTLSADGFFNDRRSKQFSSQDALTFFQAFQETNVRQYGGAIGLDVELFAGWEANLSGSYSKSDQASRTIRMSSNTGENRSAASETLSFDGTVGGSLFSINDDSVKGIVGVHYRSEKAAILDVFLDQTVAFESDKSRDVFAVFGEVYAPIISEGNRMPGVESLALSVSARYADFDDVGSSVDPKVGLAWSPIEGLNLRGTYGTSFRAPRLDQLDDKVEVASLSLFVDPMADDGESVALNVLGSSEDLDPERSRTWTAGFDFRPNFLDGFLLRGTYFDTNFRDQVGTPSISFDSNFRFTNFTGIPIRDVSQDTVDDLCARASICVNLSDFVSFLGDLSFDEVEVLLDERQQNLSRSKVAGFDFEARYDLSSAIGHWRFFLSGTRLTTFEQQVAPATPIDELLNTFSNPLKLKLRGGVSWRTEGITTSVFVNHTGDYADDEGPSGPVSIDSFTTADAAIRLDLGELGNSPLTEEAFFTISVTNVLNEDPPQIGEAPLRAATFDAANADPTGRKIALLLTKRW